VDGSFLSHKDIVSASRDFICVRPATYMDADEAKTLLKIYTPPSGKVENTAFAILAPDGKTALARPSRSPMMTYGTRAEMLKGMREIALLYTEERTEPVTQALPVHKSLALALNVASCDSRPLVVAYAKTARERAALEKRLAALAWSDAFMGRFFYVVVDDPAALKPVSGLAQGPLVAVVEPGTYGLEGRSLATTTGRTQAELEKTLAAGLAAFEPITKNPNAHVRSGQRQGKEWETEIPITGARARERTERGKKK
jgi:hypothetical protein